MKGWFTMEIFITVLLINNLELLPYWQRWMVLFSWLTAIVLLSGSLDIFKPPNPPLTLIKGITSSESCS